jgi:hypothetical protein
LAEHLEQLAGIKRHLLLNIDNGGPSELKGFAKPANRRKKAADFESTMIRTSLSSHSWP